MPGNIVVIELLYCVHTFIIVLLGSELRNLFWIDLDHSRPIRASQNIARETLNESRVVFLSVVQSQNTP